MKPPYKKPPAPPSPPKGTYYDMVEEALQARFTTTQHTTMKPQPNLDALIADHLAKFEAEKPYLEVLYAKEARGIKMRFVAFVNAGFTVEQAFEYIRTNK